MHNLISIVTPTLNQGHYIEQTIDSVLSQNYPNLEYIIIDGGSTDGTLDIIKKHSKYLKLWLSEKDMGQADALNKGLVHCSGEILNWINSDDYYEPSTFRLVNEYFKSASIDVLLGKSKIFYEDSDETKISKGGHLFRALEKTIGDALIDQPAAFFKRSIFMRYHPIDTSLRYLMDRALWIKYLIEFGQDKVVKIPDVFVNFRMHETSKTVSESSGFNLERASIFRSMETQFLADSNRIQDLVNRPIPEKLLNWKSINPLCDINAVIDEYSVVMFKEAYTELDFDRAKQIYNDIDLNLLSLESKNEISAIKRKMRLVPPKALKWLSKRKG